jgi:DNA-binding HxlR family transcriptional regulator
MAKLVKRRAPTSKRKLRELEQDGLIKRTIYAEVPPRVEYTLTPYASSLEPVWRAMADWGAAHSRRRDSQDLPRSD